MQKIINAKAKANAALGSMEIEKNIHLEEAQKAADEWNTLKATQRREREDRANEENLISSAKRRKRQRVG